MAPPPPGGEGIHSLVVGQLFSGRGIDGDHLDTRPKGPKSQPDIAGRVDKHIGINTVVVVSRTALDDQALVRPFVIGRRRIQCGVGGHTDDRIVRPEGGTGVINPIESVVVADAGRPDVGDGGSQGRVDPGRNTRNHISDHLPIDLIGGLPDLKEVVGRQQAVDATVVLDECGVVGAREHLAPRGCGIKQDHR